MGGPLIVLWEDYLFFLVEENFLFEENCNSLGVRVL